MKQGNIESAVCMIFILILSNVTLTYLNTLQKYVNFRYILDIF